MTQDEIIRMAREAGFVMNEEEAKLCHPTPKAASLKNMIERFAALVAANEREKQAKQEHKCKDHPDAPHGFCRDESITQDRYVCECEFWEPPNEAEQKPVGVVTKEALDGVVKWKGWVPREGTHLYAAPVRTKDLTDEDKLALWKKWNMTAAQIDAAIAAYKEKNK